MGGIWSMTLYHTSSKRKPSSRPLDNVIDCRRENIKMEYESVIGLEVHAQLLTKAKLFCSCATVFQADPNEQTCPVCLGMPGVLPVLNRQAVEFAIRTGLAMQGKIARVSRFDRKK